MIFSIVFVFSHLLIFIPILLISFLLLIIVLICSSFPTFLRWKLKLLIWAISFFSAINFTQVLLCYTNFNVFVLFCFVSFKTTLIFLLWPSMLFSFQIFGGFPQVFFLLLILNLIILWSKHILYDLNPFKFLKIWLMIHVMLYFGTCSVLIWREAMYSALVECNVL